MSQPGDYQSRPSIYKINTEISNHNVQIHREYYDQYDQQFTEQEQSRIFANSSEGANGTLRLKSVSIAVPSNEYSLPLNTNLKRVKSSSLGSNSQVLHTNGSQRENCSMNLQPHGLTSEDDNSANGSTRQCAYSCISAQTEEQSIDIVDILPGGAVFDSQFISDDSIKEFLVHLHFSQLMECNLYRWLCVGSSQNLSEKIKVLEIPVKKRQTYGRKNSFEGVIMKFKNGSSYAREIGEKLDKLQKLIIQFEVNKQNVNQEQKTSEIKQEHLINQQHVGSSNLNGLVDNSKSFQDSKTLQQHFKSAIHEGLDQKQEGINEEKQGETQHKSDNPKQEFRDMIDSIIFSNRSKYFSYVLQWKDFKRCPLKKQQSSQNNVTQQQSWSSSTSSCECKSQGCSEGYTTENCSNETYPEEAQMLIGHNEEFLSLVSQDRVHLSSKMIRVKKFCLFQQKISRDRYKDYLVNKIDCEIKNLMEKQGYNQNNRSCLDSYLELSFEGGNIKCEDNQQQQQQATQDKGLDKGSNSKKKLFKGIDMTTMDDIVFPLDVSIIEEENMFFKIVFFQYDIADSSVQKVSHMRVKNQSDIDINEKNGSNSDKLISRKTNKRNSLKISKQSSISKDIFLSSVNGGQSEGTGQTALHGGGGKGLGDIQLSSQTSIHRAFEDNQDSLHPKNKNYQISSEQFISKYYPKSIIKNNSLMNSQVKDDKNAGTSNRSQNNDISNNKIKLNNPLVKKEEQIKEPQKTTLSNNSNNNIKSEHDYEKEKEMYLEEQFKLFNPQGDEEGQEQINLQNQQPYVQPLNLNQQQQFTASNIVPQDYIPLQNNQQIHQYFNQPTQNIIQQPHLSAIHNQSIVPQQQQQQQQYSIPRRIHQDISPLPIQSALIPAYEQNIPKITEQLNEIVKQTDQEEITQNKQIQKGKSKRSKKEPITPKNENQDKSKKSKNEKEAATLASNSTIVTQNEPVIAPIQLYQQQQQLKNNELSKAPVVTAPTSQYHSDNQLQPQQNVPGIDPLQNQIPPQQQQSVFHQYPDTHSPYLLYPEQHQYSPFYQPQPGYYPQPQQQQVTPQYYPQPTSNYPPNSQQFMTVHGMHNYSQAPPGTTQQQGYSPRIPYSQYSPYGYNNLQQASYQQPQMIQQQFQQQQLIHQQQQPQHNVINAFPQTTPQFPPLDLNAQPTLQPVQNKDNVVKQQVIEANEIDNKEIPQKKKRVSKPKKAQIASPEGGKVGLGMSDPSQNQIGSSVKIDQPQLQHKNLEDQDKSPALQKKTKLNRKQSADNNNNTNIVSEGGDLIEGEKIQKKSGRPQNKKNQTKDEIKEKDIQKQQTLNGDVGEIQNNQQILGQSQGDSNKNLEAYLPKQIEEKQIIEQQQKHKWEQYQQDQQFQQQSPQQQQQLYNQFYQTLNPFNNSAGDNNNMHIPKLVSPYSTPYSFGQKQPNLSGQSGATFTAESCMMNNQMMYHSENIQNMHQPILPFSGEFSVQYHETLQPGYIEKEDQFYQQEP